jgi:hypothetical protein
MQFPTPDRFTDLLGGLGADCGEEADEELAAVIFGSPRPKLVAQEGELLVLVVSSSIIILAVNDFGLLGIKLQFAFSQASGDLLA